MMQLCDLCEEPVKSFEIASDALKFCCHGCSAVYKILESQNQLASRKSHPLVTQALQFGIISNPALLEKIQAQEAKATEFKKKWVFELEEMWCPACAEFIRLVVGQQRGVRGCSIDYITDLGSISYDAKVLSKDKLKKLIESLGYGVKELGDPKETSSSLTLQLAVAAFCALNVMMFAYPLYTTYFSFEDAGMRPLLAWISFGLTIPVLTYSALPLYKRMLVQTRQGVMGMESLVAIAIASAIILSLYQMYKNTYQIYFDTVTVLIAFLLLGKMIESKAKFSAKAALFRMHQALPRKGRTANGFVPLKTVQIGDEMLAATGERIVMDGIILEGEGAVDESVITGESLPHFKKVGDRVLSGSILQSGNLRFKVTAISENSTLRHILKLVEIEAGNKSGYIRSADRIVKWFTPLVLSIAFFTLMGTFLFIGLEEAFSRAMAVLLIACPCAIGIAAPLVESNLIHRFTEKGALIQNRSLLAKLPQLTHIVFDKTGTVTEGLFQVISGLEHLTEVQKQRVKAVVSCSLHPISNAIDRELTTDKSPGMKVTEIPGMGMIGEDAEGRIYLGSQRFLERMGFMDVPPSEHTSVYFADEKAVISCICLGDTIKKEIHALLQALKPLKRILLSGDHDAAVIRVAERLEFDAWHGGHTPQEKQDFIKQLKDNGFMIAMVGDGINDAPSLAKADVGISVMTATDISIQVSDLLMTTPSLKILPELITLSRKGQKLIHQNLFWAFSYNVVGIGLAVFGILTPLFASFAMVLSSLIVLFNAKRL
jgi:heavy metal translocating P-type ATPase